MNKSPSVTENKHKRIEDIKQKLLEKHGSENSPMQYRLWAEMIAIGTHSSYDLPPRIPMFTGGRTIKPKAQHTSDLTVALTTMAEAVTGALKPKEVSIASTAVTTTVTAVPCCSSPGKIADIRSKYIQQLRELHALYEIGALTETEFTKQKLPVLEQLKKFKL